MLGERILGVNKEMNICFMIVRKFLTEMTDILLKSFKDIVVDWKDLSLIHI